MRHKELKKAYLDFLRNLTPIIVLITFSVFITIKVFSGMPNALPIWFLSISIVAAIMALSSMYWNLEIFQDDLKLGLGEYTKFHRVLILFLAICVGSVIAYIMVLIISAAQVVKMLT